MTASVGKTVSVKLDSAMQDRIRQLADAQHRTPHWVMRQAIEQYVDRQEKRLAFQQAALRAWEEYQETGLHTTGDEVIAWLETWGEENELPAPRCHR